MDASKRDVVITLLESEDPNIDGRLFSIKQVNYDEGCSFQVIVKAEGYAVIVGSDKYVLKPISKRCSCGNHNKKVVPQTLRLQYAMGTYKIL